MFLGVIFVNKDSMMKLYSKIILKLTELKNIAVLQIRKTRSHQFQFHKKKSLNQNQMEIIKRKVLLNRIILLKKKKCQQGIKINWILMEKKNVNWQTRKQLDWLLNSKISCTTNHSQMKSLSCCLETFSSHVKIYLLITYFALYVLNNSRLKRNS